MKESRLSKDSVIEQAKIASKARGYDMYIIYNRMEDSYSFTQTSPQYHYLSDDEEFILKVDGDTIKGI